jgi:tripartite-type tricarboxylate transporter receptor subunit TctC
MKQLQISMFGALLSGIIMLVAAAPASALDLPCQSVRMICASKAGGGSDSIIRPYVDVINRLGADPKLHVVNISGQATVRGAKEGRNAKPDGCTLNLAHESLMLTHITGRSDFTYDAFETVAVLTFDPGIFGARKDAPYGDLGGLISHAKKDPGKVLAGVSIGGTSHFSHLMLESIAGLKLHYVSYNGSRERTTALLAGNIDIGEINIPRALQYKKTNDIKALAILAPERSPLLPDVPTTHEFGVDLDFGLDHAIFMPKGTPSKIVAYYADLFEKASQDADLKKRFVKTGTQITFKHSVEARKFLDAKFKAMKAIAEEVGKI